jgi:phosphoserine phosphatase
MKGLVLFDCDSTLSAIEGVDELARLRGEEVFARCEALTREAMEGLVPVEEVFGRRLDMISPSIAELDAVGRLYLKHIEPGAVEVTAALRAAGWRIGIVSGGFRRAIMPLADLLGIDLVEAVDIQLDADGNYLGFDRNAPTARSGGKPVVVERLRAAISPNRPIVMVGDGASDLEVKPVVDLFVGFGRYADRPKVRAGAEVFITALTSLPPILQARFA